MKKTVMVDFDGVLHSYTSGWTGPVPIDPPNPGALEFVQDLLATLRVVVFTTRASTSEGLRATKDWLARYGFPALPVTDIKQPAIAYVDDRAVIFRPQAGYSFTNAARAVRELAG